MTHLNLDWARPCVASVVAPDYPESKSRYAHPGLGRDPANIAWSDNSFPALGGASRGMTSCSNIPFLLIWVCAECVLRINSRVMEC